MESIKATTLRELVSANSVQSVRLVGQQAGYAIATRYGLAERVLSTTRGDVRLFTLETATKFLRGIGISKFEVDATNYEPGRIRKPRPDRAEALRKTRTRLRQATLV